MHLFFLLAASGFLAEHMLVTPVYVNGSGPFPFAIDLGAETSAIDPALADAAGFKPAYRVEIATTAGSALRLAGRAAFRFGGRPDDEVEVSVADLSRVQTGHPGVRGILGMNAMRGRRLLLDYETGAVEWNTAAPTSSISLPADFSSGRVVIQACTGKDRLRLVLDSGSNGLVLFQTPNSWVRKGRAQMTTLAGHRSVDAGRLRELRLGSMRLRNVDAAAISWPVSSHDGLLPCLLFRTVALNFAARQVEVSPW